MTKAMTAKEYFQAGKLREAVDAALAEVKSNPTSTEHRGLLAELFCFAGEWERADKQIDALGHQDPEAILGLSLIRQLIRAEVSRQECMQQGRPPELLAEPPQAIHRSLEALTAIRENDPVQASVLLAEAESARPSVKGVCNGKNFEGFRDLDDLLSGVVEVLTSTGKYYWIPVERIQTIVFQPPKRPRDLLWRQAEMTVEEGPYGDVFIPAVYFASQDQHDDQLRLDQLRLGRGTEFVEGEGQPTRGVGQRMFLVGDDALAIMQIESIDFTAE